MKVKDQEVQESKEDVLITQERSQIHDPSNLYEKGMQFVKRKEARINELRQQRDKSQDTSRNRSMSTNRTPRIFDEIDTNERVENRLLNYGKSKEIKLKEQRKLKELKEEEETFNFVPKISKTASNNPQTDLL